MEVPVVFSEETREAAAQLDREVNEFASF